MNVRYWVELSQVERDQLTELLSGGKHEIAADEAEFLHAALELGDAIGRGNARRLRQLAHAHEILREHLANAVDQRVAHVGPARIPTGIGARSQLMLAHRDNRSTLLTRFLGIVDEAIGERSVLPQA
jgi:hypothetical protein